MFRFLTEGLGWIIGVQFLLLGSYWLWSDKIDGLFSIYQYSMPYSFFLFFGFFVSLIFIRNIMRMGTLRRVGVKSDRALQAEKSRIEVD